MSTTKVRAIARPGFASRSAALRFASDGKPMSLDDSTRSIEFVAATEVPAQVWDWEHWDVVNEVLLMSGCRMPISGRCVFLDTHSRHSVSAVIGSFRDQRIAQGATGPELIGRAYYSHTADGEVPYVKTVEGHVTDVSVGYEIHAFVWVEDGQTTVIDGREFTGPMRVVTDWSHKELSLCPLGADENAKVRQQSGLAGAVPPTGAERNAGREQAKEQPMTKRQKTKRRKSAGTANAEVLRLRAALARARADLARAKLREAEQDEEDREDLPEDEDENQGSEAAASDATEDDEERNDGTDEEDGEGEDDEEREGEEDDEKERSAARSVVKRERSRIAEIRGICATFNVSREQEDKYVRKGVGVDAVRKEVLATLKAQRGGPAIAGDRGVVKSPLIADAERRRGQSDPRR